MKKIHNFIQKNYIACTVLGVALLVILASLITIGIIRGNRHKIVTSKDTLNLYQYNGSLKNTFTGKVVYGDDMITSLTSDTSLVDSVMYYADSSKIIIPFKSKIVFYYRDNLAYSLPKYSTLESKKDIKTLNCDGTEQNVDSFIIYDGVDTYILPDKSILTLDGDKIELSALSYIIANRGSLTYYDYDKDALVIKENIKVANLHMNNADFDLYNDVVVYNNKTLIIGNDIDNYPVYKED